MLLTPGTAFTSPELPGSIIRIERVIPYPFALITVSVDGQPIDVTSDELDDLAERLSLSPCSTSQA